MNVLKAKRIKIENNKNIENRVKIKEMLTKCL